MLKWIVGVLGAVALALLGLAGYAIATAPRVTHPVGFEIVSVPDPGGAPLQVGIWYPTKARVWPTLTGMIVQWVAKDAPVEGTGHPLVVISHGIAGAITSHADTALALADAGFVVAAPLHTGDNYREQSAIGSTNWFPDRARHVHLTIAYMLERWRGHERIDGDKIGMFGFSAGGTTALITLGGTPDYDLLKAHCAKALEYACAVWRKKKPAEPDYFSFVHDPRVKVAVVIAPGIGFAFRNYGLAGVRVPVQLWGGTNDESVPTPSNADVVRRELGKRAEWHLVENAGHFSFMVPCGLAGLIAPKILCSERPGFDRAEFHKTFNAAVVAFFKQKLAMAPRFVCNGSVCVPDSLMGSVTISTMLGGYNLFAEKTPKGEKTDMDHGVHVIITLQDWIGELSRATVEAACSKSSCIFYNKQCFAAAAVQACDYMLSLPIRNDAMRDRRPAMVDVHLLVTAENKRQLFDAENKIALNTNGAGTIRDEFVPLSALSREFSSLNTYSCSPRDTAKGCIGWQPRD